MMMIKVKLNTRLKPPKESKKSKKFPTWHFNDPKKRARVFWLSTLAIPLLVILLRCLFLGASEINAISARRN